MPLDEEIPQSFRQTIGILTLMLTVFVKPCHFEIVDLPPQRPSFTRAYFVAQVMVSLADRHDEHTREVARRKLRLHFDNSKCRTGATVTREMANHRCARVPPLLHSPDVAISDF
jgi:hypothetical protein